jgi:hypothetical protein
MLGRRCFRRNRNFPCVSIIKRCGGICRENEKHRRFSNVLVSIIKRCGGHAGLGLICPIV